MLALGLLSIEHRTCRTVLWSAAPFLPSAKDSWPTWRATLFKRGSPCFVKDIQNESAQEGAMSGGDNNNYQGDPQSLDDCVVITFGLLAPGNISSHSDDAKYRIVSENTIDLALAAMRKSGEGMPTKLKCSDNNVVSLSSCRLCDGE